MKRSAIILIMLIANATFSWGQTQAWISLGDRYASQTSVDDGFGGEWNVEKKRYLKGGIITDVKDGVIGESEYHNVYELYRSSDRVFNGLAKEMSTRKYGDWLMLNEKSLLPAAGANAAFYGYLAELKKAMDALSVYFWIDSSTGKITEVGFRFEADNDERVVFSIPAWHFTMYERILKETVFFDFSPELRKQKQIIENRGMAAGVYIVFAWL